MFEVIFEADNGKKFVFGRNGSNYFGMNIGDGASVELGTSQGFSQVGQTVQTQSVGGRTIDVTGEFYGNITQRKDALRNVCAPFTTGRLVFQKTWFMRVYVKTAPSFSAVRNNGLFKLQFFAPFPFYSLLNESISYVGAVLPQFRFPVNYGNTHRFGTRQKAHYVNVANTGDVKIPFSVHISCTGTSTNPIITNLKTYAFLKLNGSLSAGDSIEIYRDDNNAVRAELTSDGVVSDIISWIDEDSNLFELDVGDNLLSANDDEGGASLTVRFSYYPAVAALYET